MESITDIIWMVTSLKVLRCILHNCISPECARVLTKIDFLVDDIDWISMLLQHQTNFPSVYWLNSRGSQNLQWPPCIPYSDRNSRVSYIPTKHNTLLINVSKSHIHPFKKALQILCTLRLFLYSINIKKQFLPFFLLQPLTAQTILSFLSSFTFKIWILFVYSAFKKSLHRCWNFFFWSFSSHTCSLGL